MLFNSHVFILLFLPVCVGGYFFLNSSEHYGGGQIFLLLMSLWFYGYFNISYVAVIVSSVLINFGIYKLFARVCNKKFLLIIAVIINLGILMYFKYTDFFLKTANDLFKTDFPLQNIVLPLGISFFTFQQISFIVDTYKGEVAGYSFLEYACFVTFFPQLIAGPIVTHDELIPQFKDISKKSINWDNMSKGLYIFAFGLMKKIFWADTFGNAVNFAYGQIDALNSTDAVIVMLAYTMQIYFDFSGYCDMAIGIGKMLNIDLPINFNSPYKALTITEFWDRWHITLTRFFTKYVYIPLGGNRKGEHWTYINTFIVFFLSGLWHGAGFTFIVWGIGHGLFMIVAKRFKGFFEKIPSLLNWLITFCFVNIMWVFFRAESLGDAVKVLSKAAQFDFGKINGGILSAFYTFEGKMLGHLTGLNDISVILIILLVIFVSAALAVVIICENAYVKMNKMKINAVTCCVTVFFLVWSVLSLAGVSTFLYFNF